MCKLKPNLSGPPERNTHASAKAKGRRNRRISVVIALSFWIVAVFKIAGDVLVWLASSKLR